MQVQFHSLSFYEPIREIVKNNKFEILTTALVAIGIFGTLYTFKNNETTQTTLYPRDLGEGNASQRTWGTQAKAHQDLRLPIDPEIYFGSNKGD